MEGMTGAERGWRRLYDAWLDAQADSERSAAIGCGGAAAAGGLAFGVALSLGWEGLGVFALLGLAVSSIACLAFGGRWLYHSQIAPKRGSGIEPWRFNGQQIPIVPDLPLMLHFAGKQRPVAIGLDSLDPEAYAKTALPSMSRLRCRGCGGAFGKAPCPACGQARAVVLFEGAGVRPLSRSFGLRNHGSRPVSVSVRSRPAWLSVSPDALDVPPGDAGAFTVSLVADELPRQAAAGTLVLATEQGTAWTIRVNWSGGAAG
ncbi:MAG: hypothetical protein HY553_12050 [Elusimicrobia bacterium]|nr:hypothetical protein [Elusimicrobiota bacterium]